MKGPFKNPIHLPQQASDKSFPATLIFIPVIAVIAAINNAFVVVAFHSTVAKLRAPRPRREQRKPVSGQSFRSSSRNGTPRPTGAARNSRTPPDFHLPYDSSSLLLSQEGWPFPANSTEESVTGRDPVIGSGDRFNYSSGPSLAAYKRVRCSYRQD